MGAEEQHTKRLAHISSARLFRFHEFVVFELVNFHQKQITLLKEKPPGATAKPHGRLLEKDR